MGMILIFYEIKNIKLYISVNEYVFDLTKLLITYGYFY